ncbi:MAG: hypothetical protein M3370_02475, partial [Actinomycetota bacterium]|nr:hypothetical protein [Actinomycetota bacterium]
MSFAFRPTLVAAQATCGSCGHRYRVVETKPAACPRCAVAREDPAYVIRGSEPPVSEEQATRYRAWLRTQQR